MKKFRILALTLLVAFSAQMSAQDEVLMTIGDKKVTVGEFERIYNKNNHNITGGKQSPEEYLDLFVNFKLKVMEAENLGMDTSKKFLNEFNGYKDQLAKPYLTDEESKIFMIKEAYERMQYDLHVSHILLSMNSNATPEDTLARYEQIMSIRERIINGEDFKTVAKATSDDPSAKRNGGDLGYFTAFMMMYPFESAAYNTPVGEVSMPIKTSYGYHILKVHDKRSAIGQIKAAHIFIRTPEGMPEAEASKAKDKMQSIVDSLNMGISFEDLARKYSDDRNSAANGGELPLFGTGRMIKEFEEKAFALKTPGDVSPAFKTFYGWHIIKLIEKKNIGSFDEMQSELETKAFKGDRERVKKDKYLGKLKEQHHYSLNENARLLLYDLIDTTVLMGEYVIPENNSALSTTLFTAGNSNVSVLDFLNYVDDKQRTRKQDKRSVIDMHFDQFTEEYIYALEKESLPKRYPEYKYILQEYHDGILLFDLMDQKVWSHAVKDSTGLESFFAKNREEYMWGERISAQVVSCDSAVNIESVKAKADKISSGKWKEAKLNKKYGKDVAQAIHIEELLVEPGKNEKVDAIGSPSGIGEVYNEEGRFSFIIARETVAPAQKELNETRGQVTSDYQDYLEKQWIQELRAKYPVSVSKELLSTIKMQ